MTDEERKEYHKERDRNRRLEQNKIKLLKMTDS